MSERTGADRRAELAELARRVAELEAELGMEARTTAVAAPSADAALRESEERLRRMLDQGWDIVTLSDASSRIHYVNGSVTRVLGYTVAEYAALHIGEHIHPDDVANMIAAKATFFATPGAATSITYRMRHKDGRWVWLEVAITNLLHDPALRAVVASARDVTARRRVEEELQRLNGELEARVEKAVREREEAVRRSRDELSAANAALQRAALAKDEFLAAMSHELRTPLNAILGLSEAFQDEIYGPVAEPQLRALKRIEESGRHLLSLINDILDLSKVEAGQFALDRQPTSLDEVCRASLRMVQEAAHKKRIGVSYGIDDGLAVLLVDERALKQILVNLLSNAVKFTREDGSIGLEVTTSPEEGTCTFSVWDTGIGISAADQGRLFRPFVQLDSSLARHHAGTGLGLALVRRLVELHGGGIRVESEPDTGSRFTVVIPLDSATCDPPTPPSPKPASTPHGRPALPRARILLAEDDATNVALVADFFAAHGIDLTIARNGYEAVTLAHEGVPDLILMDIQMPLLDGISALRAIRQSANDAVRRIPVIAVTALAMPGDRERCRDAGADDYLTKPLRLRRLLEAIEARVPRARPDGAADQPAP